jgi:ABC-type phosphonate transport system ATPase subunit
MTAEAKVKKRVKEVLNALGAYYAMPATGGYGSSGVPDFLVCYKGRFIGIECKAGKGKTTALQEKNLRLIQEAGGEAFVVNEDNVTTLKSIMESLYEQE